MSNNVKILSYTEIAGEVIVLLGSALKITGWFWLPYMFAFGVLVFSVGRLGVQNQMEDSSLTLRRLFKQRVIGVFFLVLSSVLMFLTPGFYLSSMFYVHTSSWLLPFVIFVVIELCTAFRISDELKKS